MPFRARFPAFPELPDLDADSDEEPASPVSPLSPGLYPGAPDGGEPRPSKASAGLRATRSESAG